MNTTFILQAQSQNGGSMSMLIMMVLVMVIFYFFLIRPQQKRQKEIRKFQNSLTEGTKVVVGGGIYGTVKRIDLTSGRIEVEIAKGVVIEVDKSNVFADMTAAQANNQANK